MTSRGPIVFFGTPQFAVPTLEALCEADLAPVLVVTQPSRRVGRGRRLQLPAVAERATELGLGVEQVETVRSPEFLGRVRWLQPWVGVVVAFGQIFPRRLLEIPTAGCINLHASLLPAYRGAAPIQAALAEGESLTGVTTMQMEAGLDSGPILLQREVRIEPDEKAGELAVRLATVGGELMVKTLLDLVGDRLNPRAQDDSLASLAPKVQKGDGRVDWGREARDIYNRLRAYDPWPGLASTLRGQPVKIVDCRPAEAGEAPSTGAGTIVALAEAVDVACGGGTVLSIRALQRPGRRALGARSFINGERLQVGEVFGDAVVGDSDEP